MKDLISNCFLCGEKALHVAGKEESQVMQCINCGYTTSTKFTGTKETNEEFQKLGEDMKNWAVEENGKIWIPTIIALPIGMLYPVNIKKELKWAFAPMVEIPEDDRKDFPNEQGGFYEKKVDTDNSKIYDLFLEGMSYVNELLKQET
jgi:ribosomal protein L37E|tara:strand:+ start:1418 stop:1858 length:441 start_codon:yes stop_codon:yes gene_type:complete